MRLWGLKTIMIEHDSWHCESQLANTHREKKEKEKQKSHLPSPFHTTHWKDVTQDFHSNGVDYFKGRAAGSVNELEGKVRNEDNGDSVNIINANSSNTFHSDNRTYKSGYKVGLLKKHRCFVWMHCFQQYPDRHILNKASLLHSLLIFKHSMQSERQKQKR